MLPAVIDRQWEKKRAGLAQLEMQPGDVVMLGDSITEGGDWATLLPQSASAQPRHRRRRHRRCAPSSRPRHAIAAGEGFPHDRHQRPRQGNAESRRDRRQRRGDRHPHPQSRTRRPRSTCRASFPAGTPGPTTCGASTTGSNPSRATTKRPGSTSVRSSTRGTGPWTWTLRPDALHPNAEGYRRWVEIIAPMVGTAG